MKTKISIQPGTPAFEAFQEYMEQRDKRQKDLAEKVKDAKPVPSSN